MKRSLIILSWLIIGCSAYSQSTEYKKIYLSISGGLDFSIGTSNSKVFGSDFIIPFAKNGWGGSFEGAYFFSQNYGVGVKYHLYSADYNDSHSSSFLWDANEDWQNVTMSKRTTIKFDETTHFVGPAVFGRWTFGETKWSALANISVGYIYNKLSKVKRNIDYGGYPTMTFFNATEWPPIRTREGAAVDGTTFGITYSAGINYQIISAIGIHISVNGMAASISEEPISRKLNRVGLAAGLNYSF
ncbi:MAG: hypothetical protein LBV31_00675 [Prevotellaceae bacterium]|nr:hypothetical protein [Prevotellaceae bacterium]